ncbi:MAG TPA: alpha-amylase family glycosyl hydrolase [Spirochaetales bacterium]|nr:alpha-amylase family glycosyl hydrolase [Spirochaetales bacterium]
MKTRRVVFLAFLAAVLLLSCQNPAPENEAGTAKAAVPGTRWWENAAGPAYQVLVYSFADADGDGWGDLAGLTASLDYLNDGDPATATDLGVSALWLSPIHPSASYHGYDVLNYKAVHPRLGTLDDFDAFVAAAHERGVKVILDMVFNHTSRQHPWFLEALKNSRSEHASFYVEHDGKSDYGTGGMGRFYDARRPDGSVFRYFSAFWDGMPDLNLANPKVVDELESVLAFWLERDVDGFRFDAAKHAFDPNELPKGTPTMASTKTFWEDLRSSARAIKPDVFFIGEVLSENLTEVAAYASVFDSLFDFPGAALTLDLAGGGSVSGSLAAYGRLAARYSQIPGFQPAPLLTNHDQDRAMSVLLARAGLDAAIGIKGRPGEASSVTALRSLTVARAKLAASVAHTLPGLPFVYYGEELGMVGRRYANDDVARRDAFVWNDARSAPTVTWPRSSNKLERGQNQGTTGAAEQAADPDSILSLYRSLSVLRAASPAVRTGAFQAVPWPGFEGQSSVAWLRSAENQSVLVVHNLGADKFSAPVPEGVSLLPLWTGGVGMVVGRAPLVPGQSVSVQPWDSAVFEVGQP